nr:hypothetical protein CFP56_30522 [Quercus suber]
MDDILHDWRKLSLTEEEDTKLSLSKSKNLRSKEFVLATKFLTRRALNVEAIGRTFKPLWRAKKEFKVREAGDHILLFVFELESNAERVLTNEPWTFDKHVVLLQRFDGSTPARYLRFTKLKIWVQIHGLPMRMLDSETTIEIGETLGQVIPCENSCEQVGGDFLRIQVEIDVSKPLCCGRRIALDETKEIWGGVDLRNEKNKETRDPGEQITLKGREYGSPLNEVSISNSNLTAFHTDNVAFEMQIQELDLEISKFDKGDAHVEHTSVGVSQAPPTNEKQVAPSMQTFEPLDQPHHVTECSPSSNQGSQTLRTWRRLARDNPMKIDQPQSPTAKKRSRGEEIDYLHELPIKKAQVSKGESQKNLMAEAAQQSRQEQ